MTRIRYALLVLFAACSLQAQVIETSYALANGDRVLRHEAVMNAAAARVWKAFTSPDEMRHFIAPVVALDLSIGGVWESSYDPDRKVGMPGNIQNEVLAFVPEKMLAIRIKSTPPGFPHAEIGKSVWTVLWFEDIGGSKTRVTVEMLPWKSGPGYDVLYKVFDAGNEITLERAHDYFAGTPTDWRAQKR